MFVVEADEGCRNSSLSYSLGDGLIQTDILSQKAINPVALRTAKTIVLAVLSAVGLNPNTTNQSSKNIQ